MNRRIEVLLMMLMVIVILLMVANLALFVRMNQLQRQVIQSLAPFQRPTGLPQGAKAPFFQLVDTTGQEVSLQDFSGQRVLLAFISPSCPACQQVYPALKEFRKAHTDVAVLVISRGNQEENQRIAAELSMPILNGTEAVMQEYQVPGFPFFFLRNFKIGMFPAPADPGVYPDTYCWDYPAYWACYCPTGQRWELWCHRYCNEPDNCPTGCCDISCWWVEVGSCSCE